MKSVLIFIFGFIAGIIATLFFAFLVSLGSNQNKQIENKKTIQKIEVKGKKGRVSLYVGIPKDSVELLLGKPDDVRLNSMSSDTYENWGYKLKNDYISDLEISFKNGKMTSVDQN
jgi:hypothetical protein